MWKKILIVITFSILVLVLYLNPFQIDPTNAKNFEGFIISTSPSSNNELILTSNKELVLLCKSEKDSLSKFTQKVIYTKYSPLSTDPYSAYNFEDYLIQWSENEKYIFIIDSIYDVAHDKLIPIKNTIFFSWLGNTGLYMDNGYYYSMGYSASDFNYMAISKKIKTFSNGKIETLAESQDKRYFILDSVTTEKNFNIKDNQLVINTASLKYDAKELQEKMDKTYSKIIRSTLEKENIAPCTLDADPYLNGTYYLDNIKVKEQDLGENIYTDLEMNVYELNKKNILSHDEVELLVACLDQINWSKYKNIKKQYGLVEFKTEDLLKHKKYTSKEIFSVYRAYKNSDGCGGEGFAAILYDLHNRFTKESTQLYKKYPDYKKCMDEITTNYV